MPTFQNTDLIGSGIQVLLNTSNDWFYLAQNTSVVSTNTAPIQIVSSGVDVTIAGTVVGDFGAISSGGMDGTISVTSTGTVVSTITNTAGISLSNSGNAVTNNGEVIGAVFGVRMINEDGVVNNTGTIQALQLEDGINDNGAAIGIIAPFGAASASHSVTNSGTLQGYYALFSTDNSAGVYSEVTFTNTGDALGHIQMGDGIDVIDNAGLISGNVLMDTTTSGAGDQLTNTGTILGFVAMDTFNTDNSAPDLLINSGIITGGVEFSGGFDEVRNDGTIDGVVRHREGGLFDSLKVTNTGSIISVAVNNTFLELDNSGTIHGNVISASLSISNDSILNSGSINGSYFSTNGSTSVVNTETGFMAGITSRNGNDNIFNSGEISTISTGNGNDRITNSGVIQFLFTDDNDDTIINTGDIMRELETGSGSNFVVNEGFITQLDMSATSDASFLNTVDNSGVINDLTGLTNRLDLDNSGIIGSSIATGSQNDRIENSGTIQGSVSMGFGDDTFINTGTVVGGVSFVSTFDFSTTSDELENYGTIAGGVFGTRGNNVLLNAGTIGSDLNGNQGSNEIVNTGTVVVDIRAGEGNDNILSTGVVGRHIESGGGNDTVAVSGSVGGDIDLGEGDDTLTMAGNTAFTGEVIAGEGNDTIQTSNTANTVYTGTTDMQSTGTDTVEPLGGDDFVFGDAGVDIIDAGEGADTVNAGAGDDMITGGAGVDVLTGGAGADMFIYNLETDADTITDFEVGVDKIDLGLLIGDFDSLRISQMGSKNGEFILTSGSNVRSNGNSTIVDVQVIEDGSNTILSITSRAGINGDATSNLDLDITLLGVDADALMASDFVF